MRLFEILMAAARVSRRSRGRRGRLRQMTSTTDPNTGVKLGRGCNRDPVVLPFFYRYAVLGALVVLAAQPVEAVQADRHHLAVFHGDYPFFGFVVPQKRIVLQNKMTRIMHRTVGKKSFTFACLSATQNVVLLSKKWFHARKDQILRNFRSI